MIPMKKRLKGGHWNTYQSQLGQGDQNNVGEANRERIDYLEEPVDNNSQRISGSCGRERDGVSDEEPRQIPPHNDETLEVSPSSFLNLLLHRNDDKVLEAEYIMKQKWTLSTTTNSPADPDPPVLGTIADSQAVRKDTLGDRASQTRQHIMTMGLVASTPSGSRRTNYYSETARENEGCRSTN